MQKDPGFDVRVRMDLDGKQHTLIADVKSSGQPRYAREAIVRVKAIAARSNPPATPVFIAPFLTEKAADSAHQSYQPEGAQSLVVDAAAVAGLRDKQHGPSQRRSAGRAGSDAGGKRGS